MADPAPIPRDFLLHALDAYMCDLCGDGPFCITVTGSGGKTTTIERLARHWADRGLRVLVSTTARMADPLVHPYPFERVHLVDSDDGRLPGSSAGAVVLYGVRREGKIGSVGLPLLEEAATRFDRVLIEGDGARSLPLKIHAERDPVVPPFTDAVVAVMGLAALGAVLDEQVMYLSDRYRRLTGDTAAMVEPQVYRRLLEHPEGLFKGTGSLPTLVLCNQSDAVSPERLASLPSVMARGWRGKPFSLLCGSWKTGCVQWMEHVMGTAGSEGVQGEDI